ncbi:undecaprenyl/decaprenyl-phosphate alpha-N-acetylglucosaminyl 1-phosphate transferase [Pseudoclavibacter alba]|uniref:Undecaprenyl/decaprenyl-phosphate alpha-N-acetylglucosaminyl 1-phosphate transferase n=1 Tax=Pseudoclavibacter albus TaxID=272241 RepID=A0ABT2HWU8_9MICO|nr:MraY family glycosyltransferase [Pseudoclavibacter alba]MBN6777756.1 undecaprenyl/decaprenyl-phosphate alpha-N-acetylglucosaminyl 1-phosphate transferase [Pseudoclavibacter alba]MCT2042802.1 undecaprenyl/decaprenyl-phosphate alpha-N-acetylglucosaminyl 1-phosphate transferase [Pseudoclavibacter alba]
MRNYALIVLVAAIVTYLACRIVYPLAMKHGWHPPVRERDVHSTPKPRLGGVAMYLGFVVAIVVASQIEQFHLVFGQPERVWAIVGATTLIMGIGVLDDFVDLDWMTKLGGQMISAVILAWQGVAITSLPIGGLTVGSPLMSLAFTVLAVVLVMNAVNFIDGLDGLVAGIALIANGVFLLYSYFLSAFAGQTGRFTMAALISAIIIGMCLGFLPINWNPAKMFMGDGGALQLGLLMATSAVAVTGEVDPMTIKSEQFLPAFLPIVIPFAVLIVPLLDLTMAVVRRMSAGKSPFSADRKHLHHRLLDMGHTQLRAVLIFYAWTAVVSGGALLAFVLEDAWIALVFVTVGFIICTAFTVAPISRRKARELRAQKTPTLLDESDDPLDSQGEAQADTIRRALPRYAAKRQARQTSSISDTPSEAETA